MTQVDVQDTDSRRLYLDVQGMTCGACVRHVEKRLNTIDGVSASVCLASRTATVDVTGQASVADLCAAVEDVGYTATERTDGTLPGPVAETGPFAHLLQMLHYLMILPVNIFKMLSGRSR